MNQHFQKWRLKEFTYLLTFFPYDFIAVISCLFFEKQKSVSKGLGF